MLHMFDKRLHECYIVGTLRKGADSMSEMIMLHVLILSGLDDLKNCKIRNSIILSGWILGMIFCIFDDGVKRLISGIICMIITIILSFPLYRLGGIGAGDIKLWSVVSLIYGLKFLGEVMVYLFMIAGVVSFIRLIMKKALLLTKKNVYTVSYVKKHVLLTLLKQYVDPVPTVNMTSTLLKQLLPVMQLLTKKPVLNVDGVKESVLQTQLL